MKKKIIILGVLLLLGITQFSSNSKSTELGYSSVPSEFEFDGCSMFPDGNYLDCCTIHDKQYFFGGTWKQRLESDVALSQCVQSKGRLTHDLLGPVMFLGVRIGGAPVFPTSFRWGFGRDSIKN